MHEQGVDIYGMSRVHGFDMFQSELVRFRW